MIERAGIYCRISYDKSGEALGVARQEQDCRRLCEQRGWEVAGVYVDNDLSASKEAIERPEFERLLADVQLGTVGVVVAWDFDRLTRQPGQLERVVKILKKAGAQLATIGDHVDGVTEDGLMIARVKSAVAAEEVRKTKLRVTRKRQERAERGRPDSGGKRPFGYEKDRLTICPSEAEAVRHVVTMLLDEGQTLGAAVRWLRGQGLRPSGGGEWCITGLRAVLAGGRIGGLAIRTLPGQDHVPKRLRKKVILGNASWEPIIDQERWHRLQAWLTTRSPGRPPVRPRVLSRLVRCHCGRKMTVGSRQSGTTAYECRRGAGGCGAYIVADRLEGVVVDQVGRWVADEAVLRALREAIAGEESAASKITGDISTLEADLQRVASDFGEGRISYEEWRAASEPMRQRIDALKDKEAGPKSRPPRGIGLVDMPQLMKLWNSELTVIERRAIIELMAEITVLPAVGPGRHRSAEERVQVRPKWEGIPTAAA